MTAPGRWSCVPDEVIDDLIVWGTPERIRARVEDYAANGVTTTAPSIMGRGESVRETIRRAGAGALTSTRRATRASRAEPAEQLGVAEHLELTRGHATPEEQQEIRRGATRRDVTLGVLGGDRHLAVGAG